MLNPQLRNSRLAPLILVSDPINNVVFWSFGKGKARLSARWREGRVSRVGGCQRMIEIIGVAWKYCNKEACVYIV
jgi:hypothetical protein